MKVLTKYKMRVIRGVCCKCSAPRVTGSHCERHRKEALVASRKYRGILNQPERVRLLPVGVRLSRDYQKRMGLCYRCNVPAVTKKYCETHRLEANEELREYKRRVKGLPPPKLDPPRPFKPALPVCKSLDEHLSRIIFGYEPEAEKSRVARQRSRQITTTPKGSNEDKSTRKPTR